MPAPARGRASYTADRPLVGGPGRTERRTRTEADRGAYGRSLRYALGLIWSVRPGYIVLNLISVLWNIPMRMLDVWIMRYVVDVATATADIGAIALACAGYFAVMAVRHAWCAYVERDYNVAAQDLIRSSIQLRLHERVRTVDLAAFDSRAFYDDYARALDVLDERVIKCFTDLVNVLGCLVSLATLGGVMASVSAPLIAIVAVTSAVAIVSYRLRSGYMVRRNRAITPLMRRFQYLNDIYYQRRYAKDVRCERIDEIAREDHARCTRELEAEDHRWGRRLAACQGIALGSGSLNDAAVYLYLAWGIAAGRLSVGSFAALLNAAVQFSTQLRTLFRGLPELGETCLLIADALGLEEYESQLPEPAPGAAKEVGRPRLLTMERVGFAYGHGRPVLTDVTFEAKAGQVTAIVGQNGAGKSTIAKLLLRLYDPDEGTVALDGVPYGELRKADLRSSVAVVFQDYQSYAYSIAQNVLMRPVEDERDRDRVLWALGQVGLAEKVAGLPAGIDTPVTKEFSDAGELFSGGELQRLAIARALAKDAPIVILDEPSSALDPLAERETCDLMGRLFADRICIVVSHRLSMARDAGQILVLDEGRIVERGDHETLIAQDGLYARMWEAQAEKYRGVSGSHDAASVPGDMALAKSGGAVPKNGVTHRMG